MPINLKFLRKNIDLTLCFILAAITSVFAPPDLSFVIERLNLPLLVLLILLMCIVAGLRMSGFFNIIFERFFHGTAKIKNLCRFFIFSCYFSSMLITNDVALIIFVPLAIAIFNEHRRIRVMAPTVILQTIAANMGSMLTPIGNPQNLFIYSHYRLSLAEFFSITLPIVIISGILIYISTCFLPDDEIKISKREENSFDLRKTAPLLLMFSLCLLHVVHVVSFEILAFIIVPAIFLLDKKLFLKADYKLIALFAALFIVVGNLSKITFFQTIPQNLSGHEFIVSLVLSQIISNVPATVLLAEFTNAYSPLLLGVNIGGLGTVIASMASVISFKAYMNTRFSKPAYYLASFTLGNLALLFTLLFYYNFFIV